MQDETKKYKKGAHRYTIKTLYMFDHEEELVVTQCGDKIKQVTYTYHVVLHPDYSHYLHKVVE